ncbi:MAG: UDP-N-acetylmuramoyl-L-alanine--D-glutamate ligase [Oscillospiraceae bacterium]
MDIKSSLLNKFKGKKIGFVGIGVSHIEVMIMFSKIGLDVCAFDKKSEDYIGVDVIKKLKNNNIKIFLQDQYKCFFDCDVIFRTPGMNFFDKDLIYLRDKGKEITSEMEVFFEFCPCKIIGVTGSDGKTTTTTIISELLKKQGFIVHLGGNIGTPLLPIIFNINKTDFAVVELSSFQLISMKKSPQISLITNLSQNHLDVHKDMLEYISAKKNIFLHQNNSDKLILNFNDEISENFKPLVKSNLFWFNGSANMDRCCFIDEFGDIFVNNKETKTKIINKNNIKLVGEHNVLNYLAAIMTVIDLVSVDTIKFVSTEFNGVAHRMEYVDTINNISYYNDSIASSPTRTIAGLKSFNKKIVLIAGGYDKNLDYCDISKYVIEKVKVLVLMGETSKKIETSILNDENFKDQLQIIKVQTMEEAVIAATKNSNKNDFIVLSPASASFDLYKNFEKRGEHFKEIIKSLKGD